MQYSSCPIITGVLVGLVSVPIQLALADSEYDTCVRETVLAADGDMTVAEVRAACGGSKPYDTETLASASRPVYELSALDERRAATGRVEARPFVLTPHKPNFLLVSLMREPNQTPYVPVTGIPEPLNDIELKMQISFKAPIWRDMFDSEIDAYFAFSTTAWWQAFNTDLSSPFRESNYEPELFVRSVAEYGFLGANLAGWQLGINHQSNGRSEPRSRSWNRIMGRANLEFGRDIAMHLRAWYRIPEKSSLDNNPDIYRYIGYGDARIVWTPNRSTFTAMVRPTTEKVNFELTWSYPVSRVFRLYVEYYNGYGESLIDYDFDIERIGIGFALNDYLMRQ